MYNNSNNDGERRPRPRFHREGAEPVTENPVLVFPVTENPVRNVPTRNVLSENALSVLTARSVVSRNVTTAFIPVINNKCIVSNTKIRPSRFV